MRFCLDTDICIYAMKGSYAGMAARFGRFNPEDIGIPAMVRAELLLGVLRSNNPERTGAVVEKFLAPYKLIPFERTAAQTYAEIRHDLEKRGTPIGPNDLVIAATARARNLVLITHNTNEFGRVADLGIEDWTT
jgi:tRNA(fMet)-specific endonuclease VapC